MKLLVGETLGWRGWCNKEKAGEGVLNTRSFAKNDPFFTKKITHTKGEDTKGIGEDTKGSCHV